MAEKVNIDTLQHTPRLSVRERLERDCSTFETKVLRALQSRSGVDELDYEVVRSALGIEAAFNVPIMSNAKVRIAAAGALYRGMRILAENDPAFEFALVTFCDERWQTSEDRPVIELKNMITTTRNCLRKVSRHFLAVGELTAVTNVRHHQGGRTWSLHTHALVIGPDARERAQRMAEREERNFFPPLPNFPCLHVRPGVDTKEDLARVSSYLFKPPFKSKTLYKSNNPEKRPNLHQSEAADRYISYLRQCQVLSQLKLGNVAYASGDGNGIRKDMLKSAMQAARTKSSLLAPIHSDELLAHFDGMMRRMGRDDFSVPVVKLRP